MLITSSLLTLSLIAITQATTSFRISVPQVVLQSTPFKISLSLNPLFNGTRYWPEKIRYVLLIGNEKSSTILNQTLSSADVLNAKSQSIEISGKSLCFKELNEHQVRLTLYREADNAVLGSTLANVFVIPGILTLFPSILAVAMAIVTKQSILSLLVGIIVGVMFTCQYNLAEAVQGHAYVIYFCLLIGALTALLGQGGGAIGLAQKVSNFAKTRRNFQLVVYFTSLCIFFDDYASCLIAGSTMKHMLELLSVSREKLAFIVNICSVCVTCVFCLSSWTGVEVDYIKSNIAANSVLAKASPYGIYLDSIAYRFYPLCALWFILVSIVTGLDFGPMLKAERRAVHEGKISSDTAEPMASDDDSFMNVQREDQIRWYNGALPILSVVIFSLIGMFVEGYLNVLKKQRESPNLKIEIPSIIAHCNVFNALIWGSVGGIFIAIALLVSQKIMSVKESMNSFMTGAKSMIFTILLLVHAWALGQVCNDLHTAEYLSHLLEGAVNFPKGLVPILIFFLGLLISYATGSAWGAMSILFPLGLPLISSLSPQDPVAPTLAIACIISGVIIGNNLSPISANSIMASSSTGCDHSDHMSCQLPYVGFASVIAFIAGVLPVSFGIYPQYVAIIVSFTVIVLALFLFGERATDDDGKGPLFRRLLENIRTKKQLNNVIILATEQTNQSPSEDTPIKE